MSKPNDFINFEIILMLSIKFHFNTKQIVGKYHLKNFMMVTTAVVKHHYKQTK